MAKIVVICPSCLSRWLIDERFLGSKGRCRKCQAAFTLSRSDEIGSEPAAPGIDKDSSRPGGEEEGQRPPVGLWNVGDVILDVYEVKPIGLPGCEGKHYAEGGMGIVYRVHHRGWGIDLAVKSPKPHNVATERGKRSFERECETWVGLGLHPNVVSCYYVRRVDGIPRIFAEFMEGGTLADWMDSGRLYEGGPQEALERILDIAIQVAWGLQHAHKHGVVHQDMKPGNVMLHGSLAKVTDFGLARAWEAATKVDLDPAQMGVAVSLGGITPAYCSPEQLEAAVQAESDIPEPERTKITHRTDIWSWALTVFAMFCGRSPCRFGGQTAPQTLKKFLEEPPEEGHLPPMPPAIALLLGRCFQVDARQRPESMAELAEECRGIYRELIGVEYPRREPVTAALLANSLNNRAASLLDLGKHREAAALWEEAWQRHPWQPQVTYNRALAAWRRGEITDVDLISQLEELCKARPEEWTAAYALGLAELERGEVRRAVTALRRARTLGGTSEVESALDRARRMLERIPGCIRAFTGQPPHLTTVFVSTNGLCALSGMDESSYQLWEPATGRSLLTIDRPGDSPSTSPDKRWRLTAASDGTLTLVDSLGGQRATTFRPIRWGPSPATGAVSGDGRWRLAAGPDNSFQLVEVGGGKAIRTFRGHRGRVNSVSFAADARWALSGAADKTVRLWEVATGRCLRTLKGHVDSVTGVFLAPNGLWGLSECSGRRMHLWNLEALVCLEHRFNAPILMCDVTTAETAGQTQREFFERVAKAREAMSENRYAEAVELARSARQLPGYEVTREALQLWHEVGRRCQRIGCRDAWCAQTLEGHRDVVQGVAISRDGRWALSASSDLTLRLWELATGHCRAVWSGHRDWVRSVVFGPQDRWALSASYDRTLLMWEVSQGGVLQRFEGHGNHVGCVGVSADGRLAFSGSWDRSVRVWEVATGRCLKPLRGHAGYVNAVCPSPDGRMVLSGSDDGTVRLWDVVQGEAIRVLEGHEDWVQAVAFSPDGRLGLSASKDRTLRLWDLAAGRCVRVLQGHQATVTAVVMVADGRWALSASDDRTIRLWELETGRCHHVLEGHAGPVTCLAVSRDGRWALSGGRDRVVRLWEIDWEYRFPGWVDWDERARPYLESFLTLHCPVAADGIARQGMPECTADDFQQLLAELADRGLGWIRPEGVRAELEKIVLQWSGPPAAEPASPGCQSRRPSVTDRGDPL